MAASTPFYDKYGGFGSPDFKSMIAGQSAVDNSVNNAFTQVKDLLRQTEDIYKENNTLNVQEYLQGKLQQEGLGAQPIDKTAIQKQFGNMINMDQVIDSFATEKQQMESDAINTAAMEASAIKDPLQSRQAFAQSLRSAGAKEEIVSKASQNFADMNALRFTDYEIDQTRQANERETNLFAEVSTKGKEIADQAIVMLTKDLPEDQREAAKQKLYAALDERRKLTDDQRNNIEYYVSLEKNIGDRRVLAAKTNLEKLENTQAALQKTGVSEEAYKLANNIVASGLGNSVHAAIGNKVNNFVERTFGGKGNDTGRVKAMYDHLINDLKVDAKDANAILALAFNEVYEGDRFFGNNISDAGLDDMDARVEELGQNMLDRYALIGEITKARSRVSETELSAENNITNLRKSLTEAGKATRLRVKGTLNIDDTYNRDYSSNRQAASGTGNSRPFIIAGVDIGKHATDPQHEQNVQRIYNGIPAIRTAEQADTYIQGKSSGSPITGEMVMKYAKKYEVSPRLLMAMMQQDSSFGTTGKAARTQNPGNVGNDDTGREVTFSTWDAGVEAEAKWLSNNKASSVVAAGTKTETTDDAPPKIDITSDAVKERAEKRLQEGTATPTTPTEDGVGGKSNTESIGFFKGLMQKYRDGQERSKKLLDNVPTRRERVTALKKMSAKDQKKYLDSIAVRFGKKYADSLRAEMK